MADDVRLDKWLWAARFFKTRQLAKDAIEGGKVHYNGARSKVSKKVEIGATLTIRQGYAEKVVTVIGLSDTRGAASIAQTLYNETTDSIEKREHETMLRKLNKATLPNPTKPNKKERRQIMSFKHQQDSGD
ncbi:ribosome-associated heat shock protein Hsp15 [Cysteiniphilum sp. QT6929]|uniref:ribosome-associated heat shock protein Hsp15 n=1 Tax=Cysteiniphilum sp. QT6929 TaxID=2975055 RepID=UPI0024B3BA29|nr:ribosome-associated heat shock protein Hsp15 [Cysteiniphilum sp. QT6929]WHN65857.1 ribosome-associated heat shock protein Hsp15 [Cysteiniphilum sp. QT6929]